MKKNLLVLVSALLLAGCNNQMSSEVQSESLESSSEVISSSQAESTSSSEKESSTVEESESTSSSSVEETFDMNSNFSFVDINETLYLFENETYDLSLETSAGASLSGVSYEYSKKDIVSVDENGVLSAFEIGEDEVSSVNLAISYNNLRQVLSIKVINMNDYVVDGAYYGELGSIKTKPSIGRLSNKNVCFFGDSITHNWSKYTHEMQIVDGYKEGNINDSYVKFLNETCTFNSYENLGSSGGTMSYLPNSADRWVSKSFTGNIHDHEEMLKNYDYYFVMYGTNDVDSTANPGKMTDEMSYGQSQDASLIASMKTGIDMLRAINPDAQIYFINICYRTYGGQYDKVETYNEAIKTIAGSYCCGYLDAYSNVVNKKTATTYLNSDGLHLNADGHRLLAKYILNS